MKSLWNDTLRFYDHVLLITKYDGHITEGGVWSRKFLEKRQFCGKRFSKIEFKKNEI